LYEEKKESNKPILNTYYKNYSKILERVINQTKKMSYEKQINNSKNKIKTTWRIINNKLQKKENSVNTYSLNIDGELTSNCNVIANIFNNYFTDVAYNIHKRIKDIGPTNKSKPMCHMSYLTNAFVSPFPSIKITKTTSSEIEKTILSLQSSHSHGYDEISNNILKTCKSFISEPICFLCNKVLFEGIYPDRLKYATIIPIYKKGKKDLVSNYRPISILTSINKIFERVIYKRSLKHLNENNIISNYQLGFRENKGTENAIYYLISKYFKLTK
jgi:hypothetical protein